MHATSSTTYSESATANTRVARGRGRRSASLSRAAISMTTTVGLVSPPQGQTKTCATGRSSLDRARSSAPGPCPSRWLFRTCVVYDEVLVSIRAFLRNTCTAFILLVYKSAHTHTRAFSRVATLGTGGRAACGGDAGVRGAGVGPGGLWFRALLLQLRAAHPPLVDGRGHAPLRPGGCAPAAAAVPAPRL